MRGVKRYVRDLAIEIVMKQGVGFSKPASEDGFGYAEYFSNSFHTD